MKSKIDSEFAAFNVYRTVETFRPEMCIFVRDCVKINFTCTVPKTESNEAFLTPIMACLIFREVQLPTTQLDMRAMNIGLPPGEDRSSLPDNFEIRSRDEIVDRYIKLNRPEHAAQMLSYKADQIFIVLYHFPAEDCNQLLQGLAVDIIVSNVYCWGVRNKVPLVKDSTGRIYRLSAEDAFGNRDMEYLNFTRQDNLQNNVNNYLDYINLHVFTKPHLQSMNELRDQLTQQLCSLQTLLRENSYIENAFNGLNFPSDLLRMHQQYESFYTQIPVVLQLFKYTNGNCAIWKGYLMNAVDFSLKQLYQKEKIKSLLSDYTKEYMMFIPRFNIYGCDMSDDED